MLTRSTARTAFLLTLAGLAFTLTAPATTHAQATAPIAPAGGTLLPEGSVTTQGRATVSRTPDYVDIFLGVHIEAPTASEAQAQCTQKMEAVIKSLREMSLPAGEFKSGQITLSPRYSDDPEVRRGEKQPMIIGYTAVNALRVRTTDLKSPPRVIDSALKNGANRVDGVNYAIKEALAAREEALKLATTAAKRKADVMATALGLKVGRVLSLTESDGGRPHQYGNRAQLSQSYSAAGDASPSGDSVEPGTVDVIVDVSIAFTLVP